MEKRLCPEAQRPRGPARVSPGWQWIHVHCSGLADHRTQLSASHDWTELVTCWLEFRMDHHELISQKKGSGHWPSQDTGLGERPPSAQLGRPLAQMLQTPDPPRPLPHGTCGQGTSCCGRDMHVCVHHTSPGLLRCLPRWAGRHDSLLGGGGRAGDVRKNLDLEAESGLDGAETPVCPPRPRVRPPLGAGKDTRTPGVAVPAAHTWGRWAGESHNAQPPTPHVGGLQEGRGGAGRGWHLGAGAPGR